MENQRNWLKKAVPEESKGQKETVKIEEVKIVHLQFLGGADILSVNNEKGELLKVHKMGVFTTSCKNHEALKNLKIQVKEVHNGEAKKSD